MVVASTLLLLAYDEHANPKSLATYWAEVTASRTHRGEVRGAPGSDAPTERPQLRVTMPRLCCEVCLASVVDALRRLPWLGPARAVAGAHELELDVRNAEHADLAAVGRALSERGFVPEGLELFGMGHFRLFVELGSPPTCSGAREDLERFVRKESQDRWLDSIVFDPSDAQTMIVYPRLNAVVDLTDLTRGLGRAGFTVRTIELRMGPES